MFSIHVDSNGSIRLECTGFTAMCFLFFSFARDHEVVYRKSRVVRKLCLATLFVRSLIWSVHWRRRGFWAWKIIFYTRLSIGHALRKVDGVPFFTTAITEYDRLLRTCKPKTMTLRAICDNVLTTKT